MAPLHLMFLMPAILQYTAANCITDETDLLFTSFVYRHGDRTPSQPGTIFTPPDKTVDLDIVAEKVAKYGYGQLTEKGKMRSYQLGKSLRRRYGSLLSETYDPSEIFVGASNWTRTIESLRFTMAGLYASQSIVTNNTVVQQPVPEDVISDPFLPLSFSSCPFFASYLSNVLNSSCSSILAQYPDLLEELTTLTGLNVTERPLLTYVLYNNYQALQTIGYELAPEIEAALPEELRMAAGDALDVILGQQENLPWESGVLLNDFIKTSTKIADGISTENMHVYSAQDFTVYAIQIVSQVANIQGTTAYCAGCALELRRVVKTGKLVVLLVYIPGPGEPVVYLRVRGCGGYLCDLDTFKGITQGYSITEQEFGAQCQSNTTSSN